MMFYGLHGIMQNLSGTAFLWVKEKKKTEHEKIALRWEKIAA